MRPSQSAANTAYWPSNARILSYRHAAEILNVVAGSLASAVRLTPETACTEPTSDSQFRNLGPGEYSCEKIYPIDFCVEQDESTTATEATAASTVATTASSSTAGKTANVISIGTATDTASTTTVDKTAKPADSPAPKETSADTPDTATSDDTPSALAAESDTSGVFSAGVDNTLVSVTAMLLGLVFLSF